MTLFRDKRKYLTISLFLIFFMSHAFTGSCLSAAEEEKRARLYIDAEPKASRIRVLNIKPKFYQGMRLRKGKYLIEVSAEGYKAEKTWIRLEEGEEKRIAVSLVKSHAAISNQFSEELFRFHTVRKGDTLWKISMKYDVTVSVLKRINHLKNTKIALGQRLRIPKKPISWRPVYGEKNEKAKYFVKKGNAFRDRGNYREAIEYYFDALKTNPYYLKAFYNIGYAFLRLGVNDKAIQYFKQAIEMDPYNAASHYHLGLIYFIMDDQDAALKEYHFLELLDTHLADRLLSYLRSY